LPFADDITGFDLVGEEGARKYPLKNFINEFLQFRKQFSAEQIPFLFHCGETLDIGNDADGNLVDALLLDSKRIGHGYALTRHPYIMEQMKKRNICLELCPISNEILGLTPRVNGHSMYSLLANNVHCTVSSDNPTLFR
jgi:adenosine deaminase CECR1